MTDKHAIQDVLSQYVGRRAEAGGRLAGPAGSEGRHHADHDRLLRLGSTQDRRSVEVDPARREAQSAGVHGP